MKFQLNRVAWSVRLRWCGTQSRFSAEKPGQRRDESSSQVEEVATVAPPGRRSSPCSVATWRQRSRPRRSGPRSPSAGCADPKPRLGKRQRLRAALRRRRRDGHAGGLEALHDAAAPVTQGGKRRDELVRKADADRDHARQRWT